MTDWLELLKLKPASTPDPDAMGPKPEKKPPASLVDLTEYDKFRRSLYKEKENTK